MQLKPENDKQQDFKIKTSVSFQSRARDFKAINQNDGSDHKETTLKEIPNFQKVDIKREDIMVPISQQTSSVFWEKSNPMHKYNQPKTFMTKNKSILNQNLDLSSIGNSDTKLNQKFNTLMTIQSESGSKKNVKLL